jgi:L-serine dehydratase
MFLSVFDMFKVGIGPSSSHTMGPMVAAARFLDAMRASPFRFQGLRASLHGSLAFTGVGHATDRATILGLAGFAPDTYDAEKAEAALARIKETKVIEAPGLGSLAFDPGKDLLFDYGPALPGHANGMILRATDAQGDVILEETYYSIGGGFVLTAGELADAGGAKAKARADVPHPFETAAEMLEMAKKSGLTIAQMKRANELKFRSAADLDAGINRIWQVMNDCISRGMKGEGILPGGLKVRRRAKGIHDALLAERGLNLTPPHTINDWMSLYAMAVNEENAAGGKVVTAPTNGAAGILPAILRHYCFTSENPTRDTRRFLLTAGGIGLLYKQRASISGAEMGCQGEVGVACSMAGAGLAAVWGGSPQQCANAAEIGMEHNLGLTCDPVGGLVQIPCIERNAVGAVKAVNAARLSLHSDAPSKVSLDQVIETMRQTGMDMSSNYKETSKGGLAVNVVEC